MRIAVAVAQLPRATFDCGIHAPDGSAWELFGERYETNPRLMLSDSDFMMLRLWSMARGSGFAPGSLPDPGGTFDQAAVMFEAFALMSAAADELKSKGGK